MVTAVVVGVSDSGVSDWSSNGSSAVDVGSSILNEVYHGKAPRPQKSIMKSEKIANLGFKTKNFDEGLALIHST